MKIIMTTTGDNLKSISICSFDYLLFSIFVWIFFFFQNTYQTYVKAEEIFLLVIFQFNAFNYPTSHTVNFYLYVKSNEIWLAIRKWVLVILLLQWFDLFFFTFDLGSICFSILFLPLSLYLSISLSISCQKQRFTATVGSWHYFKVSDVRPLIYKIVRLCLNYYSFNTSREANKSKQQQQ